jgi:hypothetical protein
MKKIFFTITAVLLLSACSVNETVSDSQSQTLAPTTSATSPTSVETVAPVSVETTIETTIQTTAQTEETAVDYSVPEYWEELNASFTRDDSSQYSNASLNLKYLGNAFALFEFRLMEGSESEDIAVDTIISGIMLVNEDGTAVYETADNSENPLTINLTLTSTDDGKAVDVSSNGDFVISPDGHYDYIETGIEVSDAASVAILEHLPTAATSLNSNNGDYTINFPDALISDWFYSVEAVFNDNGETLAKFLIAKDLSAVFRVDDDIEPVMIYGTAQPMMDAYVMELGYYDEDSESEEYDDGPMYEPRDLVEVKLPGGVYMQPGASDALEAVIPGTLPYTLTASSEDESIATVDGNNVVTAVSPGETVINCTINCEDGVSMIGLVVYVTENIEFEDYVL